MNAVVIRYAEIGLKGKNRSFFERRLLKNLRARLAHLEIVRIERPWGRLIVRLDGDPAPVAACAADLPGITSVSPGISVAPDLAEITRAGREMIARALARCPGDETVTFRVKTKRSDKSFEPISIEVDRQVGGAILADQPRLRARMVAPRLMLGIEIRRSEALLFTESLAGPGGLPVGSLGRAVTLLSGGIDSPVAAWLAMKRGLHVTLLNFHSPPFIGDPSRRKVIDLARALARFQPSTNLYIAPFTEIQVAIKQTAPEAYRTILYRRMMQRIAGCLAERLHAGVVVTGECLGQVASQTVENLTLIQQPARCPVLRPLIAFDKNETIRLAERIGTYSISIRPHPDCCTVFQPRHPKTHGREHEVTEAESRLEIEPLVEAACSALEHHRFGPGDA